MSGRAHDLQVRIATLGDLGGVFGALRALSASRLQQARASFDAVEVYRRTVQHALDTAWPLVPPAPVGWGGGRRVLLVFGAEHGFCGGFDRGLVVDPSGAELWVCGQRLAGTFREHGHEPAWAIPMATRAEGVLEVARRAADHLYDAAAEQPLAEVTLRFRRSRGATSDVVEDRLLPRSGPVANPVTDPPVLHLRPAQLVRRLVDEVVLAELTWAAMSSFAAESEARMRTVQSALDHVKDKLDELRHQEAQLRQEEVTTELLDVVNGAEAARAR
ncbi:MAG: F0F1 ATP synthase subunit gamma [Myxococcales bacterium]|nr:F0F1 ATP synthase subunit gamma [Myxococcales bacterium]